MDITQLRQQIDAVDQQIVSLFAQRMDISSHIADYKKEKNMPIFDPVREQAKLDDVAAKVPTELESSVKVLYSLLFELSRSYQNSKNAGQTDLFRQITASIAHTPDLFPQQAMVACYGLEKERQQQVLQRLFKSPTPFCFTSAQAVCSAVEQGMCHYGLLPAENSDLYDLLRSHGFYIIRSFRIGNEDGSCTRMILFADRLEIYPGADKTALWLTLPNRPGSLYRVLARLYALGLNVAKLDSRPCPHDEFHIRFYLDIETSIYSQEFVHLMCELEDLCDQFEYLGSYMEVV